MTTFFDTGPTLQQRLCLLSNAYITRPWNTRFWANAMYMLAPDINPFKSFLIHFISRSKQLDSENEIGLKLNKFV